MFQFDWFSVSNVLFIYLKSIIFYYIFLSNCANIGWIIKNKQLNVASLQP